MWSNVGLKRGFFLDKDSLFMKVCDSYQVVCVRIFAFEKDFIWIKHRFNRDRLIWRVTFDLM